MARKNVIPTYQLVTSQSLAASFNSSAIPITWQDNICIEMVWTTANIVGTLTVEGSVTGNSWEALRDHTGTPISISIASTNDNGLFDLNQLSFPKLRLVFTRTSGTSGTINAWVSGKML